MTTPVLVVGEALVDLVTGRPVGTDRPREPKATRATPGGSPANVAVGLARLGVGAELVTRFGTDRYGDQLGAHLFRNGVQVAPGSIDRGFRTSTATATLDADGVASYEFDITWEPPALTLPTGCPAVHTGSIATVVQPGAEAVRRFLTDLAGRPVTVTLDPNARPTITPDADTTWTAVREFAAVADLVKLSDEDCAFLRPGLPVDAIAAELLATDRTRCVVITLGGAGACGFTRAGRIDVAAPAIEVVDTVGAGDSFMAALIARLHAHGLLGGGRLSGLTGDGLREVLGFAVRAAAITCTRHGADPPTAAEAAAGPEIRRVADVEA